MSQGEVDEIEVIDLEEFAGSDHPIPVHAKYFRIKVDHDKILVKSPISGEGILSANGLDADVYRLIQKMKNGRDVEIGPDDLVDLRADGVERFETALIQSIEIIVNARRKMVSENHLDFMQVVRLAYDPLPSGGNWLFTVSYRNGPKKNPEGTMVEGQKVRIRKGMVFNVTATDKS